MFMIVGEDAIQIKIVLCEDQRDQATQMCKRNCRNEINPMLCQRVPCFVFKILDLLLFSECDLWD